MSKLSLLYLLKCVVFCRYLKPIIRHSTFKLVIGHLVFCLTTKNNGFRCISNIFEVLKGFSTCQQRWIKRYWYHASFQSWTIYYSRTSKWMTSSWTSTSAEQISIGSNLELSGFYYIGETKVKSLATGTILFIHFWAKWGFSGPKKRLVRGLTVTLVVGADSQSLLFASTNKHSNRNKAIWLPTPIFQY